VRMISAETPILFEKACEIFILELTLRAWLHTDESKRKTLQRNDIAMAVGKTDLFDFLIDIVPREDMKASKNTFLRTDGPILAEAMALTSMPMPRAPSSNLGMDFQRHHISYFAHLPSEQTHQPFGQNAFTLDHYHLGTPQHGRNEDSNEETGKDGD